MKRIKEWFKDVFDPANDIDVSQISEALNNPEVRAIWLKSILQELKQMNMEVDRRLLAGRDFKLTDLCAKRKAYQDVLEAVLSAKRQVMQDVRPNLKVPGSSVNLDRVTA